MSAKITITGQLSELRKLTSTEDNNTKWYALEIITGGSNNAPKGLPLASKEVHFTILLNDKQFNKLESEIKATSVPMNEHKLLIQGELTLDLNFNILKGDLGVIAFQAESITYKQMTTENPEQVAVPAVTPTRKRKREPEILIDEQGNPNYISFSHIRVPKSIKKTFPKDVLEDVAAAYKEEQFIADPIVVLKTEAPNVWILQAGYVTYRALVNDGQKLVPIQVVDEPLIEEKPEIPVQAEKLPEPAIPQPIEKDGQWVLPLTDILVSPDFLSTTPRAEKLEPKKQYYLDNGKFEKPVTIDRKNRLVDGYATYYLAKLLGLEEVAVSKV